MQIVPADVQLVEENLPFKPYKEHCETKSIEAVNVFKEKSNEEPLTRNLEQAPISLRINSMEIDTKDSSEKSTAFIEVCSLGF